MKKVYWILRFCGYAGNLAGLALFVAGRRSGHAALVACGGGLMLAGLIAFVASYAVYLGIQLKRRQGG
jgi:hypothetical protein